LLTILVEKPLAMKNPVLILLFLLFVTKTTFSQHSNTLLWKQVEEHELKELPKSALKLVDSIYKIAINENNSNQLIKSLLYKSKISLVLNENAQLSIVQDFKKHIEKSSSPTKNILNNMLANLYWQYFKKNRYQFYKRTKTNKKIDSIDFRTWDLNTLFKEIHKHYQEAFLNKNVLIKTSDTIFNDILLLKKDSETYRPNLFDFLANNALEFYKTSEGNIVKPTFQFKIDNPKYFGNSESFSKLIIKTKDSLSLQYHALRIYQSLIKTHLQTANKNAIAIVDIERLKFIKKNASTHLDNGLYLKALLNAKDKNKSNESSSLYAFEVATFYFNQSNSLKNTHKKAKALKICNQTIQKFPQSFGAKKCKILKTTIEQPLLSIKAEKHLPINTHSRLLINYKNINKLHFQSFVITKKEQDSLRKIYNVEKIISFIEKLEKVTSWETNLRNKKDYSQHSTEVVVPKFEKGTYIIVASESNKLNAYNMFGTTTIQVTDIALIENQSYGEYTYQVVNRNTGKPLKNAIINIENLKKRNSGSIHKNLKTDRKGFASFKSKYNYDNCEITVNYKNEEVDFGDRYLYQYRSQSDYQRERVENNDEIILKPFIFTDRSIYRPEQKVFFKVIVLKKRGKKSEVLKNEYIEVSLHNSNNQEIKTLDLKLNEFGSVSGEFKIPNNGLTGEFKIEIDESIKYESEFYDNQDFEFDYDSDEYTFSVEEYKRPKFKTNFKAVTETYKINDSVTVKGFAKSFAGSNITNAKVSYKVVRKTHYPSWYYWRNSNTNSTSQEITFGETKTNDKGEFNVIFKAIADETISKENLPTFTYKITADVTDLNGETRSNSATVKVGYHALIVKLNSPKEIDKNSTKTKLKIITENLNGEFISAKGMLTIHKLIPPKHPLRKRAWEAPDYQDIPKKEFRRLFPNEPYTQEETNAHNWDKGKLVFQATFNTSKEKEIILKNLKAWISGKYIATINSKDKYGFNIRDEQRFTIYSYKEKSIADNTLFFIQTDKAFYVPGDKVFLKISSASKDITVTVQVEKNHQIIKNIIVHLNNETKTIKIPIKEKDLGGFAIKYHFVNYNYFDKGNIIIQVPKQENRLQIQTKIFRDKVQPGQNQTWSFSIKNDKNNVVATEMLASMYDASLDEFKSHLWEFTPKPLTQTYYAYNNQNANNSFGTNNFWIRNKKYYYTRNLNLQFNTYNWFGFSLNGSYWESRTYLRKLKQIRATQKSSSSIKNSGKYTGIINGVVNDDFGPLPGVRITIRGSNTGTETDFDGHYQLEVKKGSIIIFSYLGYTSAEITVDSLSTVNVTLEEDTNVLDEVIVSAFGIKSEEPSLGYSLSGKATGLQILDSQLNLTGKNSAVTLRGSSSITHGNPPLIVIDNKIATQQEFDNLDRDNIFKIIILKAAAAGMLYGTKAENGVIVITTKTAQSKLDERLSKVKARKNFKETAFFYPKLRTNKKGVISFNFTVPEALTKWKLQLLAHTKNLQTASKSLTTITQKELMVIPNAPRFLRQGDKIILSSKISNLTNNQLKGVAQLELTDAITGKEINIDLNNIEKNKPFTVNKDNNTTVSWDLNIPELIQTVQYRIVATSGDFSDGEQNVLPVLSNRMLVTETLPLWIRSNQSKTFTLEKLKNNKSTTLKNHKLTLEMTSNPAWNAIQALPYLMEYPYDCAEQTFSKFYANTLASYIANSSPKIKEVFNSWKSSNTLFSNLEKNQELKSLIISETPWLRDALSETEQKKRIGLLFDLNKMKNEKEKAVNKLKDIQLGNGGFPWFKGREEANLYITQHIASGFGHLKKLGVTKFQASTEKMITDMVHYLDSEILKNYLELQKIAKKIKAVAKSDGNEKAKKYLDSNHLGHSELQYLYMRSFYPSIPITSKLQQQAIAYYRNQSSMYWSEFNLYGKGQIALINFRAEKKSVAKNILKSLKENSITSDELGMYWKNNTSGYYFYKSPIATQALLIEAFFEIENNKETIDNLKIWLLKNKQTNQWNTTIATTKAVYALLLNGGNWLSISDAVDVTVANEKIDTERLKDSKIEAGTGYYKTVWKSEEITSNHSQVKIVKNGNGISWGALYWQYFEDLDKITFSKTPLQLDKKLFLKTNTDAGKQLKEITDETILTIGDVITVRIEIRSDRGMDFIHLKDMRASSLEPINIFSKYKWQDRLGYYQSTKDASTNFFFDHIPKGIYVFEYDLTVNNAGDFSNGITTIQSMYAPEFSSHSNGLRIHVK